MDDDSEMKPKIIVSPANTMLNICDDFWLIDDEWCYLMLGFDVVILLIEKQN